MDGGGTLVHAMDINGARRRSHEPTAARPGARTRIAGARTRMAGAYASLDRNTMPGRVVRLLPSGVRRESPPGHGWTGSRAEAYGGPGRAGLRSKMYQYHWGLVTQLGQQPTVAAFFRSRL